MRAEAEAQPREGQDQGPRADARTVERLDITVNTPAGLLTMPVEVPTGFVPVTEIVPLLRRLGEQAQGLVERGALTGGETISCRKGCAACCRMLIPVSAPEAYRLRDTISQMPDARRKAALDRMAQAQRHLEAAGMLTRLSEIAEAERQWSDADMEPINRAYFALRMPCPFLVDETCSIYEDRPAACRELQVTSPAEWCQDPVTNPVRALPVPLRVSTALGLLWSDLVGGPIRFIPLPLALAWSDRHADDGRRRWKGSHLLEKALDQVWRFLTHTRQD